MTQEELAKKAVVSVSMIRKIENGESEGSISTIKAIAKGRFPHFLCFLKIPVLRQTVKSGGMEHMHAVSFTISGDNQYNIYGRIVFPQLSILR